MSVQMEAESRVLEAGELAQNEAAALRANIYLILSDCFRQPGYVLADDLGMLAQMLGELYPECVPEAEALRQCILVADPEALRVQHAELFVGPYDLLAPPYGSVYLDGERRVMGNSTMDVAAIYATAGLSPDSVNHEPPDHIATALEFMYFLCFQQASGKGQGLGQSELGALQRQFLLSHLGRWVAPFTGRILASGLGGFYAALARLTAKFVALEMDRLSPSSQPLAKDGRRA